MKQASSNPEAVRRDRRERLRRQRAEAPSLRTAYPQVEQLRLTLEFRDGTPLPPATQSHILHPPARAFFRFPCPFADCDGQFDLAEPVVQVVSKTARELRRSLECQGVRARDRLTGQPCGLHLELTVAVDYAREIAA